MLRMTEPLLSRRETEVDEAMMEHVFCSRMMWYDVSSLGREECNDRVAVSEECEECLVTHLVLAAASPEMSFVRGVAGVTCRCRGCLSRASGRMYRELMLVIDSEMFTFHRYCADLDLINLCFADDLLLFDHGDVDLG
ncbi:hypothetical protein Tco_0937146 [Tanacetum coccineum]|uniref:Uncharacterized protein n=1 Tax=Tanacetum coccineum TaxID=301880 RepID=A0ABQ5DDI6_9ASTR